MSAGVRIYVEGKTDEDFLNEVVARCFPNAAILPILRCEGKDNLHNLKKRFQEDADDGITSLVIFDADDDPGKRRKEIVKTLEEMGFLCPVFLFPDDQSKGALEHLLAKLAVSPSFFDCWQQFQECLEPIQPAYKPDHHQMVYAYEQLFFTSKELRNKSRFHGPAAKLWNIGPEEVALEPLLAFLAPHLGNLG